MTYNELLAEKKNIDSKIAALQEEQREIEHKLNMAKNSQAKALFCGIIDTLREMAELGYTITVKTHDGEWGGENWHELGMSMLGIEMTSTDQQESIIKVLNASLL